jgi:uncharacterized OB-fold protein
MTEYTVKAYKDHLMKEELVGVECTSCGHVMLPPRPICNKCNSIKLEWKHYNGDGVVAAKTVIAVPLTKFQDRCPHGVVIVNLDEGASISGYLLDEKINLGSRVKATYIKDEDDVILAFNAA